MVSPSPAILDGDGMDRTALQLMLAYIEAECRRIGAEAAARHAAMAASLVPVETQSKRLN
jgi:predicted thioesterase